MAAESGRDMRYMSGGVLLDVRLAEGELRLQLQAERPRRPDAIAEHGGEGRRGHRGDRRDQREAVGNDIERKACAGADEEPETGTAEDDPLRLDIQAVCELLNDR